MVIAIAVRRRRRRNRRAEEGLDRRVHELPPAEASPVAPTVEEPEAAAPAVAELLVLNGASETKRYPLSAAPATIGFRPDCTILLGQGGPMGEERVRVWRREGKFMLHRLSRRGRVAVGGRPVTWAVLEDGDEIEIGPCRLRFRLGTGAPEGPPVFLKNRSE
jgi:hypothetical protein